MPTRHEYTGIDDPSVVEERIITPSTLETIDTALYEYVDQNLNVHSTTNKGWKKAEVVWISAERAHQLKNRKQLRDMSGSIILPVITVERASVVKDPSRKGIFYGHVPPVSDEKGGSITIARKINQDKTRNFANADAFRSKGQNTFPTKNKKVVYQSISIPMPVYVDITYTVTLRTEYQQQMNEMVTPFITKTGGINYFLLKKDDHRYESFIQQDFSQENNVSALESDERTYITKVDIKVLGYLIGEGKNQERPKVVIRENAVEVKMPRERVIMGDIPERVDKRGFYRD
tara:strand:- start:961 stop:1827 length:867 start_codon:yes stop_codon:yes gene_type:complete